MLSSKQASQATTIENLKYETSCQKTSLLIKKNECMNDYMLRAVPTLALRILHTGIVYCIVTPLYFYYHKVLGDSEY